LAVLGMAPGIALLPVTLWWALLAPYLDHFGLGRRRGCFVGGRRRGGVARSLGLRGGLRRSLRLGSRCGDVGDRRHRLGRLCD
jgi:hypothetical protein